MSVIEIYDSGIVSFAVFWEIWYGLNNY